MRKYFSKQQFFASAAAILLSVFAVAVVVYGASVVDTASVGSGTSTPGAAVGAKGAGIFEGFVHAGAFRSTSTDTSWIMGGNFGLGTTTPGAKLAVRGGLLVDDFAYMSSFTATSTTATSTTRYGMVIASTTIVDGESGRWAIGTTTIPNADVANTLTADPGLTVAGVGSTANATGTLFITGGSSGGGGQIILKSVDGTRCVAISAGVGTTALDANQALTTEVVACPR